MSTPTATWQNILAIDNIYTLDNILSKKSDVVLSQYSTSPRLMGLMAACQAQMDACPDMELFHHNVFDLDTATGVSLDLWGQILGISRSLQTDSGPIIWEDDDYKFLLWQKALANISDATAATLTRLLTAYFDEGQAYILDNQDMTIRVVTEFFATDTQSAILENYGLLCLGAGVGWEWYQIPLSETFGFDGSGLQPFNQAPFVYLDVIQMS